MNNDALQLLLQLDFPAYRIGVAYDMNTSELADVVSGNRAFELAFVYKGGENKKFNSGVVCPTF